MDHWKLILEYAPLLKKVREKYDGCTMKEYLAGIRHVESKEIRPSGDIPEAVYGYVKRILGDPAAEECARVLEETRLLFTADHHGIEYFAQSVQGNFLYEAWLRLKGVKARAIPVLAGSTVSLGSANYPRGFTLYPEGNRVYRLPVLPYSRRQEMEGLAGPFTLDMIKRTRLEAEKECQRGNLTREGLEAVRECLDIYERPEVLEQESYARQAVLVNRYLSSLLHEDGSFFVYIEIEEIVRELLIRDLSEEGSLMEKILFEPSLTDRILNDLDGADGCWKFNEERKLLFGTCFFWGADEITKRRYPLSIDREGMLRGTIPDGRTKEWKWDKESVLFLLKEHQIIPGIFVDFLELIFFRDYSPAGGCFQGEYLGEIKKGLLKALDREDLREFCPVIREKQWGYYLSGPILFTENRKGKTTPMGMCELLNKRGSVGELLAKGLDASFARCHENGTEIFYQDIVPGEVKRSVEKNEK